MPCEIYWVCFVAESYETRLRVGFTSILHLVPMRTLSPPVPPIKKAKSPLTSSKSWLIHWLDYCAVVQLLFLRVSPGSGLFDGCAFTASLLGGIGPASKLNVGGSMVGSGFPSSRLIRISSFSDKTWTDFLLPI
ncbi:hypothetical protein L6452_16861 [Arctium lappa]|uniref:Uncharacterized protein n=1 Tax=Arctium lappa TaxID=4217 RepID=A0ACB9C1W0_ARCLA|nr:hypothetical protein L6452_16861 [Arctium lappa]